MTDRFLLKFVILVHVVIAGFDCAIMNKGKYLTSEQQDVFKLLKRRMRPLLKTAFMKTDTYLIETLGVHHFNVTAAETMIKENLNWRESNNLDNIFNENFDDMQKQFPFQLESGKLRQPKVGKIEITESKLLELSQSVNGRQKFVRYLAMIMEGMTKEVVQMHREKYIVNPWTIVANFRTHSQQKKGCRFCIFAWMNLIYTAEKYYTGMMKELIIFEVPSYGPKLTDKLSCFIPSTPNVKITVSGGRKKYRVGLDKKNGFGCNRVAHKNESNNNGTHNKTQPGTQG